MTCQVTRSGCPATWAPPPPGFVQAHRTQLLSDEHYPMGRRQHVDARGLPNPCSFSHLPVSLRRQTGPKHYAVAPGEPNVPSNFSPCSLLTRSLRPQVRKWQGLRASRLSLFQALFPLARQPRAVSTPLEAVSHGLCGRFSELVNSGARSTLPKPDIFHTSGVYS